MKKIITCIALFAVFCIVNAQNYERYQIDSLLRIVNNPSVEDADRIAPLVRMSQRVHFKLLSGLYESLYVKNNRILYISIMEILLIIILIIAVLLLNRQNKINRLEKIKAKLMAEKAMAEKEKLGKQLMTNVVELSRKEQLLNKVKDMDSKQLDKAIRNEQKVSRLTKDYAKLFQEIQPEFYDRLAQQAAPNRLSRNDLKYCAYISLRMTNKDLANVLNVEYNTVVSQKHHLKKKFHLNPSDNLDEFIIKFTPPC